MKHFVKYFGSFGIITAALSVSGCMSKGVEMTEQQQRMARCDQYVDMARDQCLRGQNVTIEDYKEEYKEFEKDVRDKIKAEQDAAQKAASANEKLKEEKLKAALQKSKELADKTRQEQLEKELKLIEDGTR